MCDENDAKRHEKLGDIFMVEGQTEKARQHFLEAASIYVMQAELQKETELLDEAQRLHRKADGNVATLPIRELAQCLIEKMHGTQREQIEKQTNMITEINKIMGG
jgi:iron-sulfur cluster repair protein YtfE (RIC family)